MSLLRTLDKPCYAWLQKRPLRVAVMVVAVRATPDSLPTMVTPSFFQGPNVLILTCVGSLQKLSLRGIPLYWQIFPFSSLDKSSTNVFFRDPDATSLALDNPALP